MKTNWQSGPHGPTSCVCFLLIAAITVLTEAQDVMDTWGPMMQSVPNRGHERTAELGVAITDSPGVGVLVQSVTKGSPASHVGIQPGDFIVSINGHPVDDPSFVLRAIEQQDTKTEMSIGIWRSGEEQEVQVMPAREAKPLDSKRSWLGVTLEANGIAGAKIAQVIANSPAAQANLASGDVIVAVNDEPTQSASDLVEAIEQLDAGESVTLTIKGNPDRKTGVKLGSLSAAPPLFSRRIPVPDFGDLPGIEPWSVPRQPDPNWRDALSSLRRELDELREQMRGFRNHDQKTEEVIEDHDPLSTPDTDDSSQLETLPRGGLDSFLGAPPYQFVDRRYGQNRRTHRHSYGNSDWHNRYGVHRYPYPNYGYHVSPFYSAYSRLHDRSYYRPYHRAGVQVYVGPYGFQYYYR